MSRSMKAHRHPRRNKIACRQCQATPSAAWKKSSEWATARLCPKCLFGPVPGGKR